MRNISFALTTDAFLNGSKTVTRRLGWRTLQAGTLLRACRQCQGLPKGSRVEPLGVIRVVSVRREPLSAITADDVAREGFPAMTRDAFISMFCRHMRVNPWVEVTRIAFERVGETA